MRDGFDRGVGRESRYADNAELLHEVDGDPEAVAVDFRARFVFAGGDPDNVHREYAAWLSGEYGACLYSTTPEAIVAKSALVNAIEALLARPVPKHRWWRTALRGAVDALDALERPFAEHDRRRYGALTSSDTLVTQTRARYPDVWPNTHSQGGVEFG